MPIDIPFNVDTSPLFNINKPSVRIPSPLANPLITRMNRIVKTFEFPCNPPFRIWMQTLPEALAQMFIDFESPDAKHLFKKVFGHSWLCEAKQVFKRAVPLGDGLLAGAGDLLFTEIEIAESVVFWYWAAGVALDGALNWSTLARKASTCGGFGWLDAFKISWGIVDNGEWQSLLWSDWKIGGTEVRFSGREAGVPNSSSYTCACNLTGNHHFPDQGADFDYRVVIDDGVELFRTSVKGDPTKPTSSGFNFKTFAHPGVGTTTLKVEARCPAGQGDVFFGAGNFTVSATDNMQQS